MQSTSSEWKLCDQVRSRGHAVERNFSEQSLHKMSFNFMATASGSVEFGASMAWTRAERAPHSLRGELEQHRRGQ